MIMFENGVEMFKGVVAEQEINSRLKYITFNWILETIKTNYFSVFNHFNGYIKGGGMKSRGNDVIFNNFYLPQQFWRANPLPIL